MAEPLQPTNDYFRFCPGEERIKISNAVCLGRRRIRFPKCKGCQFNDDERKSISTANAASAVAAIKVAAAATPGAAIPPVDRTVDTPEKRSDRMDTLFKSYDIRGTYPDPLDADAAWRIGYAAAQFLRSELRGYDRSLIEKAAIIVGRDMRKSSPELATALIEGIRAGGSSVIDIGMVDTPQLYYAVNHLTCCGGVQVTASHNPAQYNGFKVCGQKGRPVAMETGLGKMLKIVQSTLRQQKAEAPPPREADLTAPYREFVHGFLNSPGERFNAERPLRIVVDASNGMAGKWFPLVFGDVDWMEIVPLNFEHNGEFLHDPNPLVEKNLTQVKDRVIRAQAQLGVCFDGDADRCVFIDAAGQSVRSDLMTALLARQFLRTSAGSAVVYDLRCSRVVPEEIRKYGGNPRRERCGHSYIKKSLADGKGVFGGELSGHFYFRDYFFCDSALVAFAHVVNLLVESGRPLSELISPLNRYAHSGERNFQNDRIEKTMKDMAARYANADIDYLDGITVQYPDWWFNVRPSNTEPLLRLNLEAKTEVMMADKLRELYPLLGKPLN